MIQNTLGELSKNLKIKRKIMQAAKALDKHYVPTRYPNAWVEGLPEDYYTKEDAKDAIKYAE